MSTPRMAPHRIGLFVEVEHEGIDTGDATNRALAALEALGLHEGRELTISGRGGTTNGKVIRITRLMAGPAETGR